MHKTAHADNLLVTVSVIQFKAFSGSDLLG